ncbi:glycoside hydrolase family 3 N-terminal domain-containing protein [Streptomyces avidinii]
MVAVTAAGAASARRRPPPRPRRLAAPGQRAGPSPRPGPTARPRGPDEPRREDRAALRLPGVRAFGDRSRPGGRRAEPGGLRRAHRRRAGLPLPPRRDHLLRLGPQHPGPAARFAALSVGLQQSALTTGARIPLLLSTDQEHGAVARIGRPATLLPGAMALGAAGSTVHARRAARIAGAELAAMGIRQDYAPVADVNVNPANPVISGPDPSAPTRRPWRSWSQAQVRGYQGDRGGRHRQALPGPAGTPRPNSPMLDLPVMPAQPGPSGRRLFDEPTFRAAVEAGVDAVDDDAHRLARARSSRDPATLSRPIVTGLVRERLVVQEVKNTDGRETAGVQQKYGRLTRRCPSTGSAGGLRPAARNSARTWGSRSRGVQAAVESGELTQARRRGIGAADPGT